jgi:crossover junction endodeoxyribonuclease RuvC
MIVLAIDPGLSGAVCRYNLGPQNVGHNFEVRRDFKTLPDIAYAVRELSEGVTHAVIELVHAMPGQGVCSMFSFGRAAGVADGALALCFPGVVEAVTPQKWQNALRVLFHIPKDQPFDSRALAIQMFPAKAHLFKRKKDHNSADACLIAVWKAFQLSSLL